MLDYLERNNNKKYLANQQNIINWQSKKNVIFILSDAGLAIPLVPVPTVVTVEREVEQVVKPKASTTDLTRNDSQPSGILKTKTTTGTSSSESDPVTPAAGGGGGRGGGSIGTGARSRTTAGQRHQPTSSGGKRISFGKGDEEMQNKRPPPVVASTESRSSSSNQPPRAMEDDRKVGVRKIKDWSINMANRLF